MKDRGVDDVPTPVDLRKNSNQAFAVSFIPPTTDTNLYREYERMEAEIERLREALTWYGEQARLAKLSHSGGDMGRYALSADGGRKARAALNTEEGK